MDSEPDQRNSRPSFSEKSLWRVGGESKSVKGKMYSRKLNVTMRDSGRTVAAVSAILAVISTTYLVLIAYHLPIERSGFQWNKVRNL